MEKTKTIEDADRLAYKERLHEFMQVVNPKESEKERDQLKQQYLDKKEGAVNGEIES